jgi:pre-mRNA-splicing factor RBM22/SLT11
MENSFFSIPSAAGGAQIFLEMLVPASAVPSRTVVAASSVGAPPVPVGPSAPPDFPQVCGACLGDGAFLRMRREAIGAECRMCGTPFTVFSWRGALGARERRTLICELCASTRNTCASCLTDLEFGLPVYLRDAATGTAQLAADARMREEQLDEQRAMAAVPGALEAQRERAAEVLRQLARLGGADSRRRARAAAASDAADPSPSQSGSAAAAAAKRPRSDAEEEIRTLCVADLPESVRERDLRMVFSENGADIEDVDRRPAHRCAFVTLRTRKQAERVLGRTRGSAEVRGVVLRLSFARPAKRAPSQRAADALPAGQVPAMPGATLAWSVPAGDADGAADTATSVVPPEQLHVYYPSLNPNRMGGVLSARRTTRGRNQTK